MALPIPSLNLSAGGGGPSGATSNAGVSTPISNPFNFDHSGWVVQVNSDGNTVSATGNKDANQTTQTPGGVGGAGLLGGLAGINPMLILAAVAAYLVIKR